MNRRNFLKRVPLAAGVLVVPSVAVASYDNSTIGLHAATKAVCDAWTGSDADIMAISDLVDIAMNVRSEKLSTLVGMLRYVLKDRECRFNFRKMSKHTLDNFNELYLDPVVHMGDEMDEYGDAFAAIAERIS